MDYQNIEQIIEYLDANRNTSLAQLSANLHLSQAYINDLLQRFAKINFAELRHFLTTEYTLSSLGARKSLDKVGFNINLISMPSNTGQNFNSLIIHYGLHLTPFGWCLIAFTEQGICHLSFIPEKDKGKALEELKKIYGLALFREDKEAISALVEHVFLHKDKEPIDLVVQGSPFQIKVWQALLSIPAGVVCSYADVAAQIGDINAIRAVASSIAKNHIAYLIPCHRVILKSGQSHNYRWGSARKKAMLVFEAGMSR